MKMYQVNVESLFAALYHDGIAKLSDHATEVEPQNEERDEQ